MFETKPAQTPQNKGNIFKGPLVGSKVVVEKRMERMRSKNITKGYTYLISATVLLAVYSVAFLYPQVSSYLKAPNAIGQAKDDIANYDNVILPNLEKERDLHKASYESEFKEKESALDKVFPKTEDKLGLISRLENFATSINAKTPPFEFDSISLGEPEKKNGYTVIPVTTSIHSSSTNFDRFLQLINLSGRLDSDILVRLMEISNISINYRGVDPKTGEDKGVDFTVKINAYSR
jgi:hypothetical protein